MCRTPTNGNNAERLPEPAARRTQRSCHDFGAAVSWNSLVASGALMKVRRHLDWKSPEGGSQGDGRGGPLCQYRTCPPFCLSTSVPIRPPTEAARATKVGAANAPLNTLTLAAFVS